MGDFSWDKVPILQATGANPAAGANPTTITTPATKRRRIHSLSIAITTSADVADRYAYLEVRRDASGTAVNYVMMGTPITASIAAQGVTFAAHGGADKGAIGAGLVFFVGFGEPIELAPSGYIQIKFLNIQAADDATAVTYAYQEAPA